MWKEHESAAERKGNQNSARATTAVSPMVKAFCKNNLVGGPRRAGPIAEKMSHINCVLNAPDGERTHVCRGSIALRHSVGLRRLILEA